MPGLISRTQQFEIAVALPLLAYVSYLQFSAGYARFGRFRNDPLSGIVVHALLILAIAQRERVVYWYVHRMSSFDESVTRFFVASITWFLILWRIGWGTGYLPDWLRSML